MSEAFLVFPETGLTAWFIEAPGGGDRWSIDALRNRPAKTPADWLSSVRFHSDLDYMEISHFDTTNINHAAVPAASAPGGDVAANIVYGMGTSTADHLLLTHNLGYEPFALVAFGTNTLTPGLPVQADANGGGRYVTVYCTSTEVRLHEFGSSGSVNLAAVSNEYTVMVFRNPPEPSGNVLFKVGGAGEVSMGRGTFNSSRQYLQVSPGGSPFGLALGVTVDVKNGAPRFVRPDGTFYDPVPDDFRLRMFESPVAGFGSPASYNGSYSGASVIQVQVP